MSHIRIAVVVLFALVAVPLTVFGDQEQPKRLPLDEARVSRIEQDIKTLRQTSESHLALIEKLTAASRENATLLAAVRNQADFQTKLLTVLGSNEAKWTDKATFVIALLALFMGVLAWRINKQIAWFTGSMESHSTISLMLKAAENEKVTSMWWDPVAEGPKKQWPRRGKHGEKVDLKTIYFGVPLEQRTKHSCLARLKAWWESICERIKVCVRGSAAGTSET